MSGYTASARIVRSAPRLARGGSTDAWRPGVPEPPIQATAQLVDTIRGEPVDPVAPDESRLTAIRERWAQLTFYLFDRNSWRT
ncbi:MAG TPA: hypothetical protein VFK35_10970 [Candidatus Limnocylindrales bacterium]|nr:hypothetical protein [Candidatus Limnocylindrales bacterium]